MNIMGQPRYYLVESSALPEVFLKVVEAKRLLETGKVSTVGRAVDAAGVSRSAFYKYKDLVLPFFDMAQGRIITFHALLEDEPGVLSGVLGIFAGSGANILTINQSIPVNAIASVTLAAETSAMNVTLDVFLDTAKKLPGVVKFEILAG